MTREEMKKIFSAYCIGYEYPFGGGFAEDCDMGEVFRHGELLIDALEKQIPKKPILAKEQNVRYAMIFNCPSCEKHFTGKGTAKYCYQCGQKLDWGDDK